MYADRIEQLERTEGRGVGGRVAGSGPQPVKMFHQRSVPYSAAVKRRCPQLAAVTNTLQQAREDLTSRPPAGEAATPFNPRQFTRTATGEVVMRSSRRRQPVVERVAVGGGVKVRRPREIRVRRPSPVLSSPSFSSDDETESEEETSESESSPVQRRRERSRSTDRRKKLRLYRQLCAEMEGRLSELAAAQKAAAARRTVKAPSRRR
eukprot:TRINITY_DN10099_c0_g1_i1.p1 TRINITY_DN10099_c0_g1~~TRINITY_DN10099_c0_g1_i1.p1  ORF type:complete len:224 (+),score=51.93 TRINITY_DN10099_c0_g1_i1:53-673(+)